MPIEIPSWTKGLHKTQAELDVYQALADQGELPKDIVKQLLDAEDAAVFGADALKDRKGKRIPQGIGSPGHETGNHFSAIRRYEGEEAYRAAARELWKRDPNRAEKLGLPKSKEQTA